MRPSRTRRHAERDRRRRTARRNGATTAGGARLGLALEQLEARRLLVTTAGGTTLFSLGGTRPSDGVGDSAGEYDQVVVAGEAVLDGTIAVQLAPGYVPQAGDRFTIMTYQSVVGTYGAGRGFFGLAGDLWFEIQQTGNATTAGTVTLVAHEVLPGSKADLRVLESDGAVAATVRDTIGTFLNRDYFGGDLQVTFNGGVTYGELDLQGTVALRLDQDPGQPGAAIDATVTGTAAVGTSLVSSGVFVASFGVGQGAANGIAVCGQSVALDAAIGGAAFAATNGRIGLLASDEGVAFEAAAIASTNLSNDLTLRADAITISYNATAVDSTGKQVTAGDVTYTFGTLPANTYSIDVSGGELIAGGFLRAAGSFAVRGGSQGITLSDGTTVTADVLTIGGTSLTGFAGSGIGTPSTAGITITGASVGAALATEQGGQGRRWLTVNGSGQSASLTGIAGVSGDLTSVSLALNLDAADGSVVDYAAGKTSLAVTTGGTAPVTLVADGSKGRTAYASGTAALAVSSSLSLAGTISIGLEGTSVFAVGDAISARFGDAISQPSLEITGASFGLVASGSDTAFELQGGLSASIAGFAAVTGRTATARYTSANAEINAGRKLGTAPKSYTFAKDIGTDTNLLVVEGFTATVGSGFTITGDVGFSRDGVGLIATGTNIDARLTAGTSSVAVSGASLGLVATSVGTAVELSQGGFTGTIQNLADVKSASAVARYTSADMEITPGRVIDVGGVSHTFSAGIAKNTIEVAATGFQATVAEFVTLSGDLGFKKDADSLVAVGTNMTATLAAGGSSLAATGAFGLSVAAGKAAFELAGTFAGTVVGLADLSVTTALVRYTSTGRTVTKGQSLVVGGASYTFNSDIAAGTASLTATGLTATVGSGFTISGDVGFSRDGSGLIATGTNIDARLTAGSSSIAVADASLGLIATAVGTAVELSQGGFSATIQDLADVKAASAVARYTSADMEIAAGRVIDVGGVSHTFAAGIAKNTIEMAATGFQATVAEFVTLSGDLGFKKDADSLMAVGTNVTATLAAGGSRLAATGAFGLSVAAGKAAFELAGTFAGSVTGLADLSATTALVRYAAAGRTVTKGQSLAVGADSYTFTGDIASGTASLTATGLTATVGSGFTISGDVGFSRDGSGLIATGTNMDARLTAGTSSVAITGASLGLVATSVGTAVELSQGGFTATIQDLENLTAASAVARYTSADMEITAGRVIDVGGVSHTFSAGIAKNTIELVATGVEATVNGFVSLSGDLGFTKDTDSLVATSTNIDARLTAGTSSVAVTGASLGLVATSAGTAVELSQGGFSATIQDLADVKVASAVARYTSADMEIAAGRVIDVGGVSHRFAAGIAKNTIELAATGFQATVAEFVTLSGDLGFRKDADTLVAVGTNIDARLTAGTSSVAATGASLGIVATSAGTAVEVSQGGFTGTIQDLADVTAASAVARYTSADMEIAAGRVIDVGGVSHTFSAGIAKNTIEVAATGFQATVAGFVTLSGDLGFKKDADSLVAVGTNVTATLAAGGSSLAASGAFGLSVAADKAAFELAGTFAGSVTGLADLSATTALVRYTAAGRTVTKGQSLVVGGASYTFNSDIAAGTASLKATGLTATVGSGFTISGDVGFSRDGSGLIATSTNIDARLTAGTSSVVVTSASLGFVATSAGTAVELSQGGFSATIQDLADVKAASAVARYTSADMTIAAGRVIDVGGVSHTFAAGIAKNTIEMAATGFQATVAEFVTLSGDLGFKKDADSLMAVGTNVTATLAAGGSSLAASGAFGLSVAAGKAALELAGTFAGSVTGLADLSATTALVRYAAAGRTVTKGQSLIVGGASYLFSGDIAAGTASLTATGLTATVGSGFMITGDVGFSRDGSGLVATGANIDARLTVGTSSVAVTNASLGLVATSAGTAVELSQGGFSATIQDLADAKAASAVARYTSADMEIAAGRVIDVGGVSHTFAAGIAKNTIEMAATGFQATVAGFVTLSGDVGFKKDADSLVAVGTNMTATLAAGGSRLTATGAFGLSVAAGKAAFELAGTFAGSVVGLADLSATTAVVRYTAAGRTVTKGLSLAVGADSYTFTGDIASGTASLAAMGLTATVGSGFTISGDVGFSRDGSGLVATGANIDARLTVGTSSVAVTNASLGLVATSAGTAVELSQGGFSATIQDLADVKAASAVARYTSADMEIAAGRVIDVGGVSHTFSAGIAKNTIEVAAAGFQATVAGFVTLSGDLGFKKDADSLVAVGTNVTATLAAGGSSLAATGAFGLSVAAGKAAFELAGTFAGSIVGLADLSATTALVRYAAAGRTVTKGQSLVVGGASYTFSDDIASGTASLTATGLTATVGSGFTLSGDVGFSRDRSGLIATSTNIDARLTAGTSSVSVTSASLGLVATSIGTAVELSQGGFTGTIQDLADVKAASAVARYTSADMEVAAGRVIDVGGVSHTFSAGIAKNTIEMAATGFQATVAEFVTLSGDLGFKKDADSLVAVGTNVTATLAAGGSRLAATGAFGLSVAAGKAAFELAGTFAGSVTGLADLSATTALVRYAAAGRTVTKGQSLAVGADSYTFTGDIASGTASLTATGLTATVGSGFTISGDVGFSRDGSGLVATSTNIDARLTAGTSSVAVTGASLGIVATSAGTAVEVSQGGFTGTIQDLADVTAASAVARYTSADMEIAPGRVIDVGGVSHTFAAGIAKNTIEVAATGFQATVAGFVTLSGDLGFKKDADSLVAVGTNVTATLTAGGSRLAATGAFGLSVAAGKAAFELAGTFAGSVTGLADLSATTALVRYAAAGRTVTKGQSLAVGADSYTFTGDIASGTASLTATGLTATVGSGFTISGDVGFSRDGSGLVATGTNIDARLIAGLSSVEVTDGSLGLIATAAGTAVELSQGGFSATIQDLADVKVASAVARYTSADMEVAAGRVIDVGGVSHTFAAGIAKNTIEVAATGFQATVARFVTLSGDLGFRKDADSLVAVGTNVTATLAVQPQETFSLTAGRLSLSVSGGKTSFEVHDFTVDSGKSLTVAGISLDVAASFEYRDDAFRFGVAGSLTIADDTVTLVNGELFWENGRFTRLTGSVEGTLLTANAWIPVSITGVSVTLPASDASADVVLEVTGFLDRGRLQRNLRQLSDSSELTIDISVFTDGDWRPVADGDTFSFAVCSTGGRLWSADVRPVRVDVHELVVGLTGGISGSNIAATVSGSVAFGGLDAAGNLVPMDRSLPSPYGGNAIAGSLSITAAGIAGTVALGGSWSADTGLLLLTGVAGLSGDFSGVGITIAGSATGSFRWEIGVDTGGPIPTVRSLPVVESIRAEDLRFVIPNVARFDIGTISYVNAPRPGMPFATATNVTVTALGVLGSLGLTGSVASLELYDDAGADRIIDGITVDGLELRGAAGGEWIHEEGGRRVISARDLVARWSHVTYRSLNETVTTTGLIRVSADDVRVFPGKDGPFDLSVATAQGGVDLATGAVALSVGAFTMGFGDGPRVDVAVHNVSLSIDDDPATDLFAVEEATVKLVDGEDSLARLSFAATDVRFNVVAGVPRLGVGGVSFSVGAGVLHAIGLAGFLPFDVTSAALSFGKDDDGYSDLAEVTLDVGGAFDLTSLEAVLPFSPTLSIGGLPAGQIGAENTFAFGLVYDAAADLFTPRNLSNVAIGFRDWKVGEFAFAGQIGIAGYVDGVFNGTVNGSMGIDRDSPRNNVKASGGAGVDLYGASIRLQGRVTQAAGATTVAVDADAESRFDLRFGDFLSISDLSFRFGFDITAQADFMADPLGRIALAPRLQSLAVGSVTAGIGDYLRFGATAAQGTAGLAINFAPQGDEPLATMNVTVSSPLIGLSGSVDGFRLLQGGVPDFDGIGRIDVSVVSRRDGSESLLQNLLSFLPLSVTQVGLKFTSDFFKTDADGHRIGIADTTAFNLIVSGQVGTPSWLPANFPFTAKSGFSDLEVDVRKLLRGEFAIVDLAGLSFDVGVDLGTVKVGGTISVGMADADPSAEGVCDVYYLAVGGDVSVSGYGFQGTIVLTTAGPVAATVAVPLAVPLGPTGFLLSGVAGSLQFATATLPDPKEIETARDLGQIPNPIDRDLTSPDIIAGVIQGLWDPQAGEVRATWDLPATLAISGTLTHAAVAGIVSGSVTLAANVALPHGDVSAPRPGLAFLGFGSVEAFGYSFVDARVLLDLRDALNPSFGFLIQAPSSTNPLGVILPVKADFGVLVKTDGLAMATAVGVRSFVQRFVAGTLDESQALFERVIDRLLTIVKTTPERSAVAARLEAALPQGTTLESLDAAAFGALLDHALDLDDLLAALGTGKTVAELGPEQQSAFAAKLGLAKALVDDVLAFGGDAAGPELTAAEVVGAFERVLRSAVAQAIGDVDAFVRSDSFDPRIVIEGALQPSLFGIPVGDPVSSASASFSKKGVFVTLDAPILPLLSSLSAVPGFAAVGGASTLLAITLAQAGLVETTTLGLELPFTGIDTQRVLDGLAAGTPPLSALNPLGPDWGFVVNTRLNSITGLGGLGLSILQVSPGSRLVGTSLQVLPGIGEPFDPQRIPVSLQSIVDRLTTDGGTLLTGTLFASQLITDPLAVIGDVIAAKNALGDALDSSLSLETLAKAFSSGSEFLNVIGNAVSGREELARLQTYLPVTLGDLLPAGLVALADDPTRFADEYRAAFYGDDGGVKASAIQDVLDRLAATLSARRDLATRGTIIDGVLNGKLLGVRLAEGRVTIDPSRSSAMVVEGRVPLLGNLQVRGVIDGGDVVLPPVPTVGPDPYAGLRIMAGGDVLPIPRAMVEASFGTAAAGEETDFDRLMRSIGLDPDWFKLDVSAQASLRGYTPAYDLTSVDPVKRLGGFELTAGLDIPNFVDNASFQFQMSIPQPRDPADPSSGTYIPFSGVAKADWFGIRIDARDIAAKLFGGSRDDWYYAPLRLLSIDQGIHDVAVSLHNDARGTTFTAAGTFDLGPIVDVLSFLHLDVDRQQRLSFTFDVGSFKLLSFGRAAAAPSPLDVFLSSSSIAENVAPGTVVGELGFFDAAVDSASLRYEFVAGDGDADNGRLRINGNRLETTGPLDATGRPTLTIRVQASDGKGQAVAKAITISVANVNEPPTDITLSSTGIAENVTSGTVVGTLSTTDPDAGDTFTYTLVAGDGGDGNASFQIVGNELRTAATFDYESRSSYSVRVRSTDSGGLHAERSFVITVADGNDAPTALTLSAVSVVENVASGTVVGGLASVDQDPGDTVTYSLVAGEGGADDALFQIVGDELRTAAAIDYETASSLGVRVRATDAGGRFTERSFTISVANVKEAPAITLPSRFTAVEDTPATLAFVAPPFGTSDASPRTRVAVVLRVERGAILAASVPGVTVGGTGQGRSFEGTIGALNHYFTDPAGRIRYQPAANDSGSRELTVTVSEASPAGVLRSSASATIDLMPVDDAPVVRAPSAFRVVEDVRGAISWAHVGLPFVDVDSPHLTVTLAVPDGVIDAESGGGVTVGGSPTARTFVGSPATLNAYFRTLGRIGYTTAPDNTASRVLTTSVWDGETTVTATSRIRITPVNDTPTIAPSATFTGAMVGQPLVITHAMLASATGARDAENARLQFQIQSIQAGRVERWDGRRWVPLTVWPPLPGLAASFGTWSVPISSGDRIRWVPPPAASGSTPAFRVRVLDGVTFSSTTSQVTIDVAS